MTTRRIILETYPDSNIVLLEPEIFDRAIIGICEGIGVQNKPIVDYDVEEILKINMEMGMSYEEAIEFYDHNQACAYVGEYTPIFIAKIPLD